MTRNIYMGALLCALTLNAHADDNIIEVSPAIPAAELEQRANTASIRLKEVRKKIVHAQKDLKTKQVQQQHTKKIIHQANAAIERVRKELLELNRQQKLSWNKLNALQNDLTRLQTEVNNTKAQVARLLVSNYRHPQPEALALFLHNTDTEQKSRLLQYSRYINSANDTVLKQLGEQQKQLNEQQKNINNELARLKRLTAQQQAKLRQLGNERSHALNQSRQLNTQIQQQNSQINQLRGNERNLNGVLARISARRSAQQRAQSLARQKAAQMRAQVAKKAANGTKLSTEEQTSIHNVPSPAQERAFSHLQGQMRRPVAGVITGRFGQTRSGGGVWRGVFIATTPAPVQSIARGEVAYAANLKGYGNTVIVDHGNDYLSIYTGLSSIHVSQGQTIGARQTIGNSGTITSGEQGLYFEIRYRNRAMNPLSWVR